MRITRQVSAVALVLTAIVTSTAMAQVHTEFDDAGDFVATAQDVARGAVAIDGAYSDTGIDIDVYRVCLSGNQTFSASTLAEDGGSYPEGFNPSLFLFDSEGRAVYYNNNIVSGVRAARLPSGHELTPVSGGTYYLAIAATATTLAVGETEEPLFDQPAVGVGGAISALPLYDWGRSFAGAGPYRIALTGICAAFTVSDFLPPVNSDAVNSVKAGRTIPVKWLLTDGNGNPVEDPSSFVAITSDPGGGACTGPSAEIVETAVGNSGLQYLGAGLWQFNWKTSSSYAGQCRQMTLTLSDGTEKSAIFQFK